MLSIQPIGIIHSPFTRQRGTPIQPRYASDARGEVEVFPEYAPALDDLEGFERLWLLFWLDRSRPWKPHLVPYRDTVERGLFSTRAPSRPNPLGLSCVRLLHRDGARLHVTELDILDGTPLLDIKPYVPEFDAYPDARHGWLESAETRRKRADDRFGKGPPG